MDRATRLQLEKHVFLSIAKARAERRSSALDEGARRLNEREFREQLCRTSPELRADLEAALAAVAVSGLMLWYFCDAFSDDREVVEAAVASDGRALQYASERLRADRDVVLLAVRHSGLALRWASRPLRADRELVLEAVRQDGHALSLANEAFLEDRAVVFAAVAQAGLECCPFRLRADKDVVLVAVRACQDLQAAEACYLQADPSLTEALPWAYFQRAAASCLAVQGQEAPVVTGELSKALSERGDTSLFCKARLLSGAGASFVVQTLLSSTMTLTTTTTTAATTTTTTMGGEAVADAGPGTMRSAATLTLDDLAKAIVDELAEQVQEINDVKHIYLNFVLDDSGDCRPITVWESGQLLHHFLLPFESDLESVSKKLKQAP